MSERFAWIYDPIAGVKRWVADMWSRRHILTLEDDVSDLQTAVSGLTGGKSVPYGYCTTAAGTAAKTVTVSPAVTALSTGLTVAVKMQYANTASNPTINVNSLGAVAIKRYGTTAAGTSAASNWNANSVVMLTYDGTYWMLVDWNNTTYSGMTDAEYRAGTGTSNRLITPKRLKEAIQLHAPVQSVNGATGAVTLDATDVGALPDTTAIPSATSDLTNDSGFITASDVPDASSATPAMDGTGAAGSSDDYARADHVHPHDTSKQDALSITQMAAVDSGITAEKVAGYDERKAYTLTYTSNPYVTNYAFNRITAQKVSPHLAILSFQLSLSYAMSVSDFVTIGQISGISLAVGSYAVVAGQHGTGAAITVYVTTSGAIRLYSESGVAGEWYRAMIPMIIT